MDEKQLKQVKLATLAMQRYSWEQGVVAQAFLECGDTDAAMLMALEGMHRQIADGRCAQMGGADAVTDPCCIGEALIYACEQTGDPALLSAKEKLLTWALHDAPRSQDGIIYHLCSSPQVWVDSFYMLPPFLARAGYYDEAIRQLNGYWSMLYDADKGLLSHIWNEGAKTFVRKDCWGVGNGWAAAGMTRVIAMLPEGYADQRQVLIQRVDSLLRAALRYQRPDRLFHDVLDDPFSFLEINCAQMFAYTMYRGMKAGWLERSYLPIAEGIVEAVAPYIDQYGVLHQVCGVPNFDAPHVAPEGQAFLLLMHAARRDFMAQ